MMSRTAVFSNRFRRAGSSPASASAARTSVLERIPITLPAPSTTGMPEMWASARDTIASATVVSLPTVLTLRCISSATFISPSR
jgi:hypothetical protein